MSVPPRVLFLFLFFVFSLPSVLLAKPADSSPHKGVYKWQDENGVVHFTTEKPFQEAKPVELPKLMRGEVKLVKRNLISCSNHGGTDCEAGPDTDGSVICRDGFRKAHTRYRLSCHSPKLSITHVSDLTSGGSFSVIVRNEKSVKASNPAVLYRPGDGKEFQLNGPDSIEPFGLAEFFFEPKDVDAPFIKATLADLDVKCANCS
ncbi:MAG: DUF4124 domain-containing protein [Bdellovibrionales bacterium]|nr:DUF4124 domain-containing protein [Bdellovibrionales bacterium]